MARLSKLLYKHTTEKMKKSSMMCYKICAVIPKTEMELYYVFSKKNAMKLYQTLKLQFF